MSGNTNITRVFIIRHGEAEATFSNDKLRQLTHRGRQQVSQSSHKIGSLLRDSSAIDVALVSPYVRAQQTFDILSIGLLVKEKIDTEAITPMSSASAAADLLVGMSDNSDPIQNVLVVSHMPLVSFLTAELTNNDSPPIFSTSAFAVIDIDNGTGLGQLIALVQNHE